MKRQAAGAFWRDAPSFMRRLASERHRLELLEPRPQPFELALAHAALLGRAVGAVGQHVELLGLRHELDPHAGSGLAPRLVEETALELAQPSFRRSDQILDRRVGLAHLGEYGFGGNAAVHHKDAPGLTVLRLDLGQEDAQRRVVGRVAGEHLVGERQAFRRHHQGDDDLDAVGALIAAIAEAALVGLILRRIGFEIGAGQIVKQHIEAGVEEIAPAIDKMAEQSLLVGEEKVMAGIELVGLGEAEVTAEQIGQRALAVPDPRCRNHSLPGAISR